MQKLKKFQITIAVNSQGDTGVWTFDHEYTKSASAWLALESLAQPDTSCEDVAVALHFLSVCYTSKRKRVTPARAVSSAWPLAHGWVRVRIAVGCNANGTCIIGYRVSEGDEGALDLVRSDLKLNGIPTSNAWIVIADVPIPHEGATLPAFYEKVEEDSP